MTAFEEIEKKIARWEAKISKWKAQAKIARSRHKELIKRPAQSSAPAFEEGQVIKSLDPRARYTWRVEYVYKSKKVYIVVHRKPDKSRKWARIPFKNQHYYIVVDETGSS